LQTNALHIRARNLKTAILRRSGRLAESEALARETIKLDCLDFGSHNELALSLRQQDKIKPAEVEFDELARVMRSDPQNYLDLAFEYANAGLYFEAGELLGHLSTAGGPIHPMILYCLGSFARQSGDEEKARVYERQAAQQSPDYCFPFRLEEILVLRGALKANPQDARCNYYLGNALYDKHHTDEAVGLWKRSAALEPNYSIPWRNLGLAAYNACGDLSAALEYYQCAFQVNPKDPRTLYELDQIRKRLCVRPGQRLAELEKHLPVVHQRDDLTIELVMLYNRTGQPEKALDIMHERRFHPWEGGEALIFTGWSTAHMLLGRSQLENRRPQEALEHIKKSMTLPHIIGEAGLERPNSSGCYYSGLAAEARGELPDARQFFQQATDLANNWQVSSAYYRALALQKLGNEALARQELENALECARQQMDRPAEINYFYTNNPSTLFVDDANRINRIACAFRAGLAYLGLGKHEQAKAALAQVLELDPSHQEAWEEFNRL